MLDLITIDDIILAMLLAAVFTWIINRLIDFVRIFNANSVSMNFQARDLDKILEKCYDLFPREIFQFQGEIYKRGMKIRVVTNQQKVFEGRLLGLNSDNMLCLMTRKFIIAHAITNIDEIETIE